MAWEFGVGEAGPSLNEHILGAFYALLLHSQNSLSIGIILHVRKARHRKVWTLPSATLSGFDDREKVRQGMWYRTRCHKEHSEDTRMFL